jgi:hypothetical protein
MTSKPKVSVVTKQCLIAVIDCGENFIEKAF